MNHDERDQRAGDEEHVERVPLREGVRPDLRAAREELRQPRAGERRRAVQVDPHHGCPVRGLIPGEEVAGEAHQHPHHEDERAGDPQQLAWILVRAEEEDAGHVHEEEDYEDARAPAVHSTHEPAQREVVRDVLDRRVRDRLAGGHVDLRGRLVVHRQDRPRQRLRGECDERPEAERLRPADVARHVPEQEPLRPADERRPFVDPVERREHRQVDDVLAFRLTLRRHTSRSPGSGRSGRARPRARPRAFPEPTTDTGRSSRSRPSPRRCRLRRAHRG